MIVPVRAPRDRPIPLRVEETLCRAAFEDRLQAETARVNRYGGMLGMIVFGFDRVPNAHQTPWDKPISLAVTLAKRIRAYDVLGPWSTNEFALLVPERELVQVVGCAVRLRRFIDEYPRSALPAPHASFGATCYRRGEAPILCVERAQGAMARAQAAGGNRVAAQR